MKSEEHKQTFATIASYYDALMSFVDYPAWVSYIEAILTLNKIKEKTILDLACGTGVCLELWWQKGYNIIGLDNSIAMLEVCKKRLSQISNGSIYLINGDMRNFVFAKRLPIITCLYDSLNYLLTEEDLLSCFQNVREALDNNGIFIFDMNTVHCLRDEWGNSTFHRQDANIHSVWTNSFNPETNISSLTLTLNIHKNGEVKTIREFHQERAYPLITITDLLSRAGFEYNFYRHLTFNPAHEINVRIMGVAKK